MSVELEYYVKPVSVDDFMSEEVRYDESLLSVTDFWEYGVSIDAFAAYDIVIIGVGEDRTGSNQGCGLAPNSIRKSLYSLYLPPKTLRIADLGNVIIGKEPKDTYAALFDIVSALRETGVLPVVLGGSQDLTYPLYRALAEVDDFTNVGSVDGRIDGGYKHTLSSMSVFKKLVNDYPKAKVAVVGYQGYLVPQSDVNFLVDNNHIPVRLGQVRSNHAAVEPVMRDSDLVVFDIGAVRQSDAPGNKLCSPNGLYAEEVCQLARYAGISDRSKMFGIFEVNPEMDLNNQTTNLAGQIVWHFIEGFASRKEEFPEDSINKCKKYIVNMSELNHMLTFYQSKLTGRWWIEVDAGEGEPPHIISCSKEDYEVALKNDIPDCWMREHSRLIGFGYNEE